MPLSRLPRVAQRDAEVVLGHGPVGGHVGARVDLQRRAMGGDGLFEPRRAALALAENPQRDSEPGLGRGQVLRIFCARPILGENATVTVDRGIERTPASAALGVVHKGIGCCDTYLRSKAPIVRCGRGKNALQQKFRIRTPLKRKHS